jgi:hypothetical protein
MVIFVKHRFCYYRRFEHDIWGLCLLDLKSSNESSNINFIDKINIEIIKKKLIK